MGSAPKGIVKGTGIVIVHGKASLLKMRRRFPAAQSLLVDIKFVPTRLMIGVHSHFIFGDVNVFYQKPHTTILAAGMIEKAKTSDVLFRTSMLH